MKIHEGLDFKEMPWKNGGGVTKELFRLSHGDSFLFRLSCARVESDGPFSLFPGIDRILLLLKGAGFELHFKDKKVTLKDFSPISFSGEEPIDCRLINGSSIDFNVMTNRNFATSKLEVVDISQNESCLFTSNCHLLFLYDKDEEKLYELAAGESYNFKTISSKKLIRVDVELNDQRN